MLAFERVLRVRARRPNGSLSVGSSTLITQRLALTAAHVIVDPATGVQYDDIEVAMHGSTDFHSASTVWVARGGLDAALVEVIDQEWSCSLANPVRLGRATGRAAGLPIEAIGFPRVLRGEDRTRDTEHLSGTLNPGTGLVGQRYDISVTSAVPDRGSEPEDPSPWAGLSGAGLTSGQLLIGIVIQDTLGFGEDRLTAIPIYALTADPAFRRLLSEAGQPLLVESVELAPLLVRLARAPRLSPATLLRADLETVPFRERVELARLLTWSTSSEPVDARVVTGPGGLGKTRLARELVRRMADSGWVAGFLQPDRSGDEMDLAALASAATPMLLVVDYAETRTPQLARLLTAVWDASDIAPVRLLLLARTAGDWWTQLRLEYPDPLATATVTSLTALYTGTGDRAAAWQGALEAFADRLPDLDPGTDWRSLTGALQTPVDLVSDKYGSPLNLQVAALAALLQAGPHPITEPGDRSREDVLLDHERRYWRRTASERHLDYQPVTLELAVAAATLLGASSEQEATATLARVPLLQDQALDARLAVARWIADLYPTAHDQYWGALQPDPLAEHHIATVLRNSDRELLDKLLADATYDQRVQGLDVPRSRKFAERGRARCTPEGSREFEEGVGRGCSRCGCTCEDRS